MNFLSDSAVKQAAALKAQERLLLRQKRLALVAKKRNHSDEVKIETVKTFLALGGNLSLTSGATNIPYYTLREWKSTQWWKDVTGELQKEDRLGLTAKTKDILARSIEQLADRIEHGDFVLNQKTGKIVRRPIQAKDLHRVTMDMMDKKERLEKSMEDNVAPESDTDRLKSLAERFAALAVKAVEKQQKIGSDDVVDIEAKEIGN